MGVEDERQGSEVMWDIKYGGGLSRVQEVDVLATQESNERNCVKDKREGGKRERGTEGMDWREGRRKGGSAFQAHSLSPGHMTGAHACHGSQHLLVPGQLCSVLATEPYRARTCQSSL